MVIKIALRELSKGLDVHRLLHGGELSLERVVLARLNEGEYFVSSLLIDGDLFHGKHFRINTWPVLLWGA